MSMRPSFGIVFIPQFPPETLAAYARQAEAAGLDSLWLYEDCFYSGAFTSAATLLAATERIKVGIGLLPAMVRNPLFAAMEIATLARLYPGRFMPGFGHGWEPWMRQIGAYAKPSLKALEETVMAVRGLLSGAEVTLQGEHIHLDRVRQLFIPEGMPPLYVGGVREKTLRLAGQIADGTLLSVPASAAYVRWAKGHIAAGGRTPNVCSVTVVSKVGPDGAAARAPVRRWLADCIQYGEPHLFALGIDAEAAQLIRTFGATEAANHLPEAWVDEMSASGTPDQAMATVRKLVAAGADEVVLAPVEPDPARFQETIRCMLPLLKDW